jgi:hypothetical protein
MYQITPYTRRKAQQLGVLVRPSQRKGKKLDVYKGKKKVASVGALGYNDYPTFLKTHGQAVAAQKRKQYKQRHAKNRLKKGTPGYYADQLLW